MMLGGWAIKNYQLWVRGVLISLAASLVVFSFVSRKPLCIDSKVVERIDIVSSGSTQATAYRCSQLRHVDFNSDLSIAIQDLSKKLPKLEKYVDLLGPLVGKIQIVLNSGDSQSFYLDNKKIYLSLRALEQPEVFEKSFLQFWLRQKIVDKSVVNSASEEILVDFLFYAFAGKLDYLETQRNPSLWPRLLSDVDDYCVGPERYNKDFNFCKTYLSDKNNNIFQPKVSGKKHEQIWVQESVRPLIVSSLISMFRKLTTSERLLLLQKMTESFVDPKIHILSLLTAVDEQQTFQSSINLKSMADLNKYVHSWYQYLSEIEDMQGSVHFAALYAQELLLRGYDLDTGKQKIDVIVFVGNIHDELNKAFHKQLEPLSEDAQVAFSGTKNLEWIGQGKFIPVEAITNLKAKKGVALTCGFGDVKSLLSYAKQVDRLLLIDNCQNQDDQGDNKLNIESYFKSGAKFFASKNKHVRFIEFHSASLLAAIAEDSTEHLIGLMVQKKHPMVDKKYDSALIQHLGWTQTFYDKALDIYQPQSVIEFVNYFRL